MRGKEAQVMSRFKVSQNKFSIGDEVVPVGQWSWWANMPKAIIIDIIPDEYCVVDFGYAAMKKHIREEFLELKSVHNSPLYKALA